MYVIYSRLQIGSERVKFCVKNQKNVWLCWNCVKSDCLTSLGGFEWFLNFFDFNTFNLGKCEKLDF